MYNLLIVSCTKDEDHNRGHNSGNSRGRDRGYDRGHDSGNSREHDRGHNLNQHTFLWAKFGGGGRQGRLRDGVFGVRRVITKTQYPENLLPFSRHGNVRTLVSLPSMVALRYLFLLSM